MSRWRNTCPDVLLTRLEHGHNAQLYLLRQTGPTGFLVKEQESDTKHKVLLGATHTCDCPVYLKEREICKHIIWILTRKFRVPKEDPLVYQLGLNERELNDVVYGRKQTALKTVVKTVSAGDGREEKRKEIDEEDVCPICQEDIFRTKKAMTHCKFGCGNSIHINCMKVWADHQLKALHEEVIKCPLCRTEFASHQSIVQEYARAKAKEKAKLQRSSTSCKKCNAKLRSALYYRCSVCKDVVLCNECFQTRFHDEHAFEYREKAQDRWKVVDRIAVSLTLNVSHYDVNRNCTSAVRQGSGTTKKMKDRVGRLRTGSANSCSLPDLGLGISGTNVQTPPTGNARSKAGLCPRLPRLDVDENRQRSPAVVKGRVKMKKYPLKTEHVVPKEGISDIISVLSLT